MENLEVSAITGEEVKKDIYTISLDKFILLTVLTFGIYQTWWIYKSWRFFRDKEKLNYNPAFRTVFSIIFLIPLFSKINKLARSKGYEQNYSSVLLFFGFFLFCLTSYLPFPFFLTAFLAFLFLLPPFFALNYAMDNCDGFNVIEQDAFNGRQIFLIVVGGLWWILILLAILL